MNRSILLIALSLCALSAHATTITIESAGVGSGAISTAIADRDAWILSNFGPSAVSDLLVDFESYSLGAYYSLNTAAGTFSLLPGSSPGNSSLSDGTKTNQFSILDAGDSPFKGRFDTTPGGSQWLDSNDTTKVKLATTESIIYFFINDVNDCGGTLTIRTKDGTTSTVFAPTGQNGNLYFVGIQSSGPIGAIQWLNTSDNDGWGIDDIGTVAWAATPEPAAMPIGLAGLLAIPLIRKYKSRTRQVAE